MDKLKFVDAMRGYAIFGVILVHVSESAEGMPTWLSLITTDGARGVQLFYLMSAFTLFYSMSSRVKTESYPVINYFLRRFFRIAPMFYIATVFYYFSFGPEKFSVSNVVSHFFFFHGLSPYWINTITPGGWSVAVEMMFYVFVPLLFVKVKSLKASIILTLGTLVLSVGLLGALLNRSPIANMDLWHTFLGMWLPSQAPVFALGIVLFFLFKKYSGKVPKRLAAVFIASSLMLLLLLVFVPKVLPVSAYAYPYGFAFVIFAFGLSQYPVKVFINGFWGFLGKISFSAYLTHFAVIDLVNPVVETIEHPAFKFLLLLALVMAVTMAMSTITYRLIEMFGIDAGKLLIRKIESRFSKKETSRQHVA